MENRAWASIAWCMRGRDPGFLAPYFGLGLCELDIWRLGPDMVLGFDGGVNGISGMIRSASDPSGMLRVRQGFRRVAPGTLRAAPAFTGLAPLWVRLASFGGLLHSLWAKKSEGY